MTDKYSILYDFASIHGIDKAEVVKFLKTRNEASKNKNTIVAYTDGSCSKNGRTNSNGGIGIYFQDNVQDSISQEFNETVKELLPALKIEKSTNQKTELLAILKAIVSTTDFLDENPENKLVIKSDSMYCINCLTKWYKNWERNNWINSSNKPVLNQEIIQETIKYIKKYGKNISFKYVPAHTEKPDEHSPTYDDWYGNNEADKLAVSAHN